MQIHDLVSTIESLWPLSGAEDWDAPGFAVSHPTEVSKVLLTVDVTADVLAEAKSIGANFVFSHHPFLLKGASEVNWDSLKGSVLQQAVRDEISIYSAHTNADIVENGVSDTIARSLGLLDIRPLAPTTETQGHGRIGHLSHEISLQDLAAALVGLLPFAVRGISVAGDPARSISTVALCGGAGDAFISNAFESGADVYITSDLRHHVTLDAISRPRGDEPMALIDISHWAAESLWLEVASSQLAEAHPEVSFAISKLSTDPWNFVLNGRER